MNNHFSSLLTTWFAQKDDYQWVLASIIETQGSAYRKAGAMMLLNSLGQSYGLLSGGCLEGDLLKQAQKCLQNNSALIVCYDMQEDSDIAWQLGIGCGGLVKVLLQPINQANNYLDLMTLHAKLTARQACYYQLSLALEQVENFTLASADNLLSEQDVANRKTLNTLDKIPTGRTSQLVKTANANSVTFFIKPTPSLTIIGGGIDAKPLLDMATILGWHTCIIDSRSGYARAKHFNKADFIINQPLADDSVVKALSDSDAIVIMQHNIHLDAQALLLSCHVKAKYLGLLGPQHRTAKVMALVKEKMPDFNCSLANPIGLDLGGELPESIALSIVAQIHAVLENASARPLGTFDSARDVELSDVG